MFPSFHTLSSLFVHFAPPPLLLPRSSRKSFELSFFLPHYPWLLSSYINPAPVDWVPQGVFFFFFRWFGASASPGCRLSNRVRL